MILKHFFRNAFILVTLTFIFSSCSTDQNSSDESSEPEQKLYEMSDNSETNLNLVNDYLAALIAADSSKLKSLVNEGFMSYGPSANDSSTIDQVIENWTAISLGRTNQDPGVIASNSLTVHEGEFAGEWANFWGAYTGTDNATGTEFNVPWHAVYRIENGKLSLTRAYFDNLAPSLATNAVAPVETD